MKFKIDTENKTISIIEALNVGHLVKVLKAWLPNGEWKNYEIRAETFLWSNPVIIQRPFWYDTPSIFTPYVQTINEGATVTAPPVLTTTNFCVSLLE